MCVSQNRSCTGVGCRRSVFTTKRETDHGVLRERSSVSLVVSLTVSRNGADTSNILAKVEERILSRFAVPPTNAALGLSSIIA